MSDELDLLIHRHLDGTLDDDDARRFQERLRTDPDARARLAEMAYEHALLRESLVSRERTSSSRAPWLAAALILAALGVALLAGPWRRESPAKTETPAEAPKREGYQGFRGRVHARVMERREKARPTLRVGEVLAVRPGSEAGAPQSLIGVTISVLPPRMRDGDPPGPERDHVLFLAKLQPGQEVVLELRHVDGADFAIEALTEEQAEWARRDDRKKPPKEMPRREGDREK